MRSDTPLKLQLSTERHCRINTIQSAFVIFFFFLVFLHVTNGFTAVNKSYFNECGGIQLLVQLMEYVSETRRCL